MGNDLGGNAKMLWSIVAGTESSNVLSATAVADLISQDGVGVLAAEDSELHAKVYILNGKIAYDASSIAPTVNARGIG